MEWGGAEGGMLTAAGQSTPDLVCSEFQSF